MDKVQVYRSYHRRRDNQAWWDCKPQENGAWKVHFHADYVESADFVTSNDRLFATIESMHNDWKARVDAHWDARLKR